MNDDVQVIHNKELMRFEVNLNGEFAFIEYKWYKGDIAFMHSVVPPGFGGKGIGSKIARAGLDYANRENLKIMLFCPFVSKFVKEHEEFHHLVDTKYHTAYKT